MLPMCVTKPTTTPHTQHHTHHTPTHLTTRLMKTVSAARRASMKSPAILYFSTTLFSGRAGTITPGRRGQGAEG